MSHKATTWLGDLDPKSMTHGAFRVLFHLCDCHNPSQGCYPSQKYLAEKSGLARSGVNLVLSQLEAQGLISRHQSVDPKTRKQRPTRYLLAFEKGFRPRSDGSGEGRPNAPTPSPDTGHGNGADPSPDTGHGTVSSKSAIPCPLSGQSRVHRAGHKPVKEPVRETARAGEVSNCPDIRSAARRVVDRFRMFGRLDHFHEAPEAVQNHIIAAQLLTDEERQTLGLSIEKGVEHD